MNSRAKITIAITASLNLLASPTIAQHSDDTIDEIIVTATKRELPVQGVPINIAAFEAERIKEGNLFDIERLSHEIPGLNVVDYGAENSRDIILRGMNATRLQVFSISGTTSIYVNDTVIDYTKLDINDVARVEVLRGPQGTLYGGGAVGGTIRYVTNKPDLALLSGWVETGLSDTKDAGDAGWQVKAVLNAPLIDDKLALRIFAGYKEVPGFIDKIGYPDRPGLPTVFKQNQNSNDRFNVRAAVRWMMNEDIEATFAYTGQRLDTEGTSGATPAYGAEFTGEGGILNDLTDENIDLYVLDIEANLNFARLTSNTAYHDEEVRVPVFDSTRQVLELSEALGWDYELFPQYYEGGSYAELRQRFTQEFRLVSNTPDTFIDYVTGLFYRNLKYQEVDNYAYAPGLPDFLNELYFGSGESSNRPDDNEFIAHVDTESTELALFGEITFNLTDRWDIVLGGRWFDFEIDGYVDIASPMFEEILDKFGEAGCAPTQGGIDPTLFPCTFERSVMDNSLRDSVYKINTSYQFDRADALLFATIAEGYRPGGANFSNASWGVDIESRFYGYDPDKATSYELGIKSMLLDDRLRLNASVYHIDWADIHLGTRVGAGFPAIVNGDDASIDGIEVDLTALLSDALQLDVSVAKFDAELAQDTVTTPEIDGQKGDRLPGSPDLQVFLALRYETEFGNAIRWWARAAGSYSSDVTAYLNDNQFNQLIDPPELSENRFFDRMSSYTVWNLATGLERDRWGLYLHIDNLFDEKYVVASSTFELGPVDDPISRQHFYGRPRTITASLRYAF